MRKPPGARHRSGIAGVHVLLFVGIVAAFEELPAVERAARPAMSAVSPTEIANKAKTGIRLKARPHRGTLAC